jgi:hypothetical protein
MTPTGVLDPEVVLAIGYMFFLVAASAGLALAARLAHAGVHYAKNVGFRYHRALNAWQCTEGNLLRLREMDHVRRIARYRGHAHVCNQCRIKHLCTDSDDGRELVYALDWPRTEIGRLYLGLALMLLVLASLVAAVELARHHNRVESLALGAGIGFVLIVGSPMLARFR